MVRPANILRNRPTIGVLVGWQVYTGMLDSFLDLVFQGIFTSAAERDVNILVACGTGLPYGVSNGRPAWPIFSPSVDFVPVGPWNCDGLIIIRPTNTSEWLDYADDLVDSGYPVVFTENHSKGSVVVADNAGGIDQAFDHLVAHGHRQIAFIKGDEQIFDSDCYRRLHAYLAGLERYGMAYNPDLVANGFHTFPGGQLAMAQILKSKAAFSAVIASNDMSAAGAMNTLQSAGLVVPQDVAVVGFDNRIDARAQIPMLTTIQFPMFDLGYQSVDLLADIIRGKITEPKTITIPTHLVIRGTCGCLPGDLSSHPGAGRLSLSMENDFISGHQPAGIHMTAPAGKKVFSNLSKTITTIVRSESHHLGIKEVEHLCKNLVDALQTSLEEGNTQNFSLVFHQILMRASAQNDDLFTWQEVISILRMWYPLFARKTSTRLGLQQADAMFDQARVAISEISRGQLARMTFRQMQVADQIGQMTSRFFAANNESEVFSQLLTRLPDLGISQAAVVYYPDTQDENLTWSELQSAANMPDICDRRFLTRDFPPEGLFSADMPYSLALLPLFVQDMASGFVALDTGNMQVLATIVQQLAASLRDIQFYRQAIEARQAAELGKRMAEEANRLKNHFLSWVVHELRTPLNLIYGLSDMLISENGNAAEEKILVNREDIDRIHIGSEHLVRLVRDVLDLASSELGQLKLVLEPLDLVEELREVSVIGSQMAHDKGLEWSTDIGRHLPEVRADRTRIRQVVLNLISNAVKFTTRGGIALEADVAGDMVMVTIRDTGLGIPLEEQEAIFHEFHQSERTSERGFGGLGLGLSISQRLIELHGGEIGVYSSGAEESGSSFFFTLPVTKIASPLKTAGISSFEKQKLLLLVNDLDEGMVLKDRLASLGHNSSLLVVKGDIDWQAKVMLEQPQAVVLDLSLASQSGWEILKMIKENPQTQDIPVLFCSLKDGEDSGSLLELDYLTKPVKSSDLVKIVADQGVADGAEKAILIVDDDQAVLDLNSRIIQTQFPNCQVIQAHNGREALLILSHTRPDLVLLDLIMPGIDGFTVLEKMRQSEGSQNIPVIVLTGQSLSDDDMQRLNCGVASVLGKGMYTTDETLHHITNALVRRWKTGIETQRIVFRAMSYIHAKFAEQVTRNDLAEFVGLSERHLSRCFNQELGISPMTYLNRYRVKRAKELLKSGHKNITQIAEEVGFSSSGYFTRVFRDEVGVSPREYMQGKVKTM